MEKRHIQSVKHRLHYKSQRKDQQRNQLSLPENRDSQLGKSKKTNAQNLLFAAAVAATPHQPPRTAGKSTKKSKKKPSTATYSSTCHSPPHNHPSTINPDNGHPSPNPNNPKRIPAGEDQPEPGK
ncbi:hypothetical protein Droror1_Dr00026578 [Drosera rotundifolia]